MCKYSNCNCCLYYNIGYLPKTYDMWELIKLIKNTKLYTFCYEQLTHLYNVKVNTQLTDKRSTHPLHLHFYYVRACAVCDCKL